MKYTVAAQTGWIQGPARIPSKVNEVATCDYKSKYYRRRGTGGIRRGREKSGERSERTTRQTPAASGRMRARSSHSLRCCAARCRLAAAAAPLASSIKRMSRWLLFRPLAGAAIKHALKMKQASGGGTAAPWLCLVSPKFPNFSSHRNHIETLNIVNGVCIEH